MVTNTFKSTVDLSAAVSQVAINRSKGIMKVSAGAIIREKLENDPEIKMELDKMKKK